MPAGYSNSPFDFLPLWLLRILRETPELGGGPGKIHIVIRQPYAYLEEPLRRAFEGQGDVEILVDRRRGEPRRRAGPIAVERRRADRRRPKEELLDVVIGVVRGPATPPQSP